MQNNGLKTSPKVNSTISITEGIYNFRGDSDPEVVVEGIDKTLAIGIREHSAFDYRTFKAVSLNEFQNGVLMCDALFDQFRTFAIDMMRQLQFEYKCETISEKATTELAAMEYVRTLELTQRMTESLSFQQSLASGHTCGGNNSYYSSDKSDKSCRACNRAVIELKIYENLGRELDRANRHFLATIQTLRMMKQPPLQLTINSDTTVVGQNQIVQTNNRQITGK